MTSAPSAPAAATAGEDRWQIDISDGHGRIDLAEGLVLEWQADLPANTPGGVIARTGTEPGLGTVEIETPLDCQWIRLVAEGPKDLKSAWLAVQVMIRLFPINARTEAMVEPVLARRSAPDSTWRSVQPATRNRLSLAPRQWHRIAGLFSLSPPQGNGRQDVILNLPEGYRIELAQYDVDRLSPPRRAMENAVMENGIAVHIPFTATALDTDSAPEVDLARGARPGLPDLAAWLAAADPPATGLPDRDLQNPERPPSPARLTANLLMSATDPRAATLVEAACARAGYPMQLTRERRGIGPDPVLTTRLLDAHIGCGAHTLLSPEDHLAMAAMARAAESAPDGLRLGPPDALVLTGPLPDAPEDRGAHLALLDSGLLLPPDTVAPDPGAPEARQMTLAPTARLSEIALALLRCLPEPADGLRILGRDPGAGDTSWSSHIIGAPALETPAPLVPLGHLGPAPHPDAPGWHLARADVPPDARQAPKAGLDPDHAFALVVCPGDTSRAKTLLNIENCLVFESYEALRRHLGQRHRARLKTKPVIPLGPHLKMRPDHLVQAVARHWSYGGRHVLSWLACDYDQIKGRVRIGPPPRDVLRRFALTPMLLSLPLSEALNADMDQLILLPACGFAIACALPGVTEEQVAALRPSFAPEEIPAADHVALMQAGPLDSSVLDKVDLSENWPAATMLRGLQDRNARIRQRLQEARVRPGADTAARALEVIAPRDPSRAWLADDISGALKALSEHPDALSALPPVRLGQLLELARSADSADDVAAGLAPVAGPLCRQAPTLARPIFELLALALPPAVLAATCAAAIGEIMQDAPPALLADMVELTARFCPPDTLGPVLAGLYRIRPEALADDRLIRAAQPVVAATCWPGLRRLLEPGLADRLERERPALTRFCEALADGDRDRALRIMRHRDLMAQADPVAWLDQLRSQSAVLRDMALPTAGLALPMADSQPLQRLAGIVFSDLAALTSLQETGALDEMNALNATARHMLGDGKMLGALIAESFEGTAYRAFPIAGDTVADVFDTAQTHLSGLPVSRGGPLVSVILSAYEPDPVLLRRSLASLAAQTHSNLEILIIDDANPPDRAAEINALAAEHRQARVIRMDTNSGPYLGRNRALTEARGEFIAIQDADDWSHPQRLAAQLAAFRSNPDAQLVTTQHIRIDRDGEIQLERGFEILGDGPMTSLFRRETFDVVGDFIAIRSRGDVEMRERIRSYFGHPGICVLPIPMMLCFAEATTLSQRVAGRQGAYLQLMRRNIDLRPSLAGMGRDGVRLRAGQHMPVPWPLRAPGAGRDGGA